MPADHRDGIRRYSLQEERSGKSGYSADDNDENLLGRLRTVIHPLLNSGVVTELLLHAADRRAGYCSRMT